MTEEARSATPDAIVDALRTIAGPQPHARPTFAKGQCVRGTFTPDAQAFRVTASRSFAEPSALVGRLSVGGGNPGVADTNKLVLRGFAFRFGPEGATSDLITESAPVHFARTLDQMLGFLRARAPGPDGKPDAEAIKAFSDANPETTNQAAFIAARPLPGSFAGVDYWAVHSFPVTDGRGGRRFVKFKVAPTHGTVSLGDDEAAARAAGFLLEDLRERIAAGTASLELHAVLDRPDDPTMDVTQRWPDEDARETVRLGRIDITALEDAPTCDAFAFDPRRLAEGVGLPPDEIFAARVKAYPISLRKRQE